MVSTSTERKAQCNHVLKELLDRNPVSSTIAKALEECFQPRCHSVNDIVALDDAEIAGLEHPTVVPDPNDATLSVAAIVPLQKSKKQALKVLNAFCFCKKHKGKVIGEKGWTLIASEECRDCRLNEHWRLAHASRSNHIRFVVRHVIG